ncbi:MAG: alpha/beta fold hydrolase [Solirubrobacterales bacterium]
MAAGRECLLGDRRQYRDEDPDPASRPTNRLTAALPSRRLSKRPIARSPAAIPGARLELLEDVGHMFWWERPLESAELIVDFLG